MASPSLASSPASPLHILFSSMPSGSSLNSYKKPVARERSTTPFPNGRRTESYIFSAVPAFEAEMILLESICPSTNASYRAGLKLMRGCDVCSCTIPQWPGRRQRQDGGSSREPGNEPNMFSIMQAVLCTMTNRIP